MSTIGRLRSGMQRTSVKLVGVSRSGFQQAREQPTIEHATAGGSRSGWQRLGEQWSDMLRPGVQQVGGSPPVEQRADRARACNRWANHRLVRNGRAVYFVDAYLSLRDKI